MMARFTLCRAVEIGILNLLAIGFYFFIATHYGLWGKAEQLLTASSDTATYLEVAKWLGRQQPTTTHLIYRPFLFPLLIAIGQFSTGTLLSVWWLQMLFWILCVNGIYFAVYLSTSRTSLAWLCSAIWVGNLSVLAISFHAMSEMTALFLGCASVCLFAWAYQSEKLLHGLHLVLQLLLLGLLTVTKPVFLIPFVILLLGAIVLHRRSWRCLGFIVLACAPVMIQVGLVHHIYGEWTVSKIGALTIKDYLQVQVYAANEQMDISDEQMYVYVKSRVAERSLPEVRNYLIANMGLTLNEFIGNVKDSNLLVGSGTSGGNGALYQFTKSTNYFYFIAHCVSGLLLLLGGFIWKQKILPVLGLLGVGYWIIFSSGVSFWQGDRLVLTAFPFWLTAYAFLANQYMIGLVSLLYDTGQEQQKTQTSKRESARK